MVFISADLSLHWQPALFLVSSNPTYLMIRISHYSFSFTNFHTYVLTSSQQVKLYANFVAKPSRCQFLLSQVLSPGPLLLGKAFDIVDIQAGSWAYVSFREEKIEDKFPVLFHCG